MVNLKPVHRAQREIGRAVVSGELLVFQGMKVPEKNEFPGTGPKRQRHRHQA